MSTKVKSTKSAKSGKGTKVSNVDVSNVVIDAPTGAGVGSNLPSETIGSSVGENRGLSSDHVAIDGGSTVKDKGRNNFESQFNALIEVEETEQQAKEDRLYNKIVKHFLAPAFNADKLTSDLISGHIAAGGSLSPAIISKVSDMVSDARKKWAVEHPAPLCNVALVLDVIKNNYAGEFRKLVDVPVTNIKPENIYNYSYSLGVLLSKVIPSDASAEYIVRSVLSYRHKVSAERAAARLRSRDNDNYFAGLRLAVGAGVELNRSDDDILNDVKYYLRMKREQDRRDVIKLRDTFNKKRAELDAVCVAIAERCPNIIDLVGTLYVVRLGDVKRFHVPADVRKNLISKYRSLVGDITRINAALWGVSVIG